MGGGVLCLALGRNKPENFEEILAILKDIVDNHKHYSISIYDTEQTIQLGLPQYIEYDTVYQSYHINDIVIWKSGQIFSYDYYFSDNGNYSRKYSILNSDYFNIPSMQQQITELENKLNEITQTE